MDLVDQSWQRTERLRLRPPEPGDADDVRRLRQDAQVMRFLGGAVDEVEAKLRFERDLRHWEEHGYGLCVVEELDGGGFAGLAGFRHFEGDPDLNYLLRGDRWGTGLATEAATACLAWGFDTLGAELVRAMTDLRHRASQRVLTKIGLRYVGERVIWGVRQRCYAMTAGAWYLNAPDDRPAPPPVAAPTPRGARARLQEAMFRRRSRRARDGRPRT